MKLFFSIFALLISFTCFSLEKKSSFLEWGDMDNDQKYILASDFCITNEICYPSGTPLHLDVKEGGYEVFIVFQFTPYECKYPEKSTNEEVVAPSVIDPHRDRSVIAKLNEDCHITVWVETLDYYSPSYFRDPEYSKLPLK